MWWPSEPTLFNYVQVWVNDFATGIGVPDGRTEVIGPWGALINPFTIALISSTIATLFGTVVAYGASRYRILTDSQVLYFLMLRLVPPFVVAATFLFLFILNWSEYFFALILSKVDVSTLPVHLNRWAGNGGANGFQAALSVGATVPLVVIGLLSRGHILLEGLPGLGKTALVRTIGAILKLDFSRVQFTPDLMPGDVVGSHILQEAESGKREMIFEPGPVFTNILLADEINRASPKTQSAMLETMQERSVTLRGVTRDLPDPFFVLASQNPIEMEGTYPLPEAQVDRFMLMVRVGYPTRDEELMILDRMTGLSLPEASTFTIAALASLPRPRETDK